MLCTHIFHTDILYVVKMNGKWWINSVELDVVPAENLLPSESSNTHNLQFILQAQIEKSQAEQ